MPEGDSVYQTASRLHQALAGAELVRAELRVPQAAVNDLTGYRVLEVVSRGKHLLTRLSDGLTLHTHLGMDGKWIVRPASTAWPSTRAPVRAVLASASMMAIGQRLARVDLLHTNKEHEYVGQLGPDLLGADWSAGEAVRRLQEQPERPIGEALLDQRNLAGIGNLYRSELLFLRGVRPSVAVGEIEDLHAMVTLAHKMLWVSRDRRNFRLNVYERGGRPCFRCGSKVVRETLGPALEERSVWFCPHCQR